jgi:hypothetical protein
LPRGIGRTGLPTEKGGWRWAEWRIIIVDMDNVQLYLAIGVPIVFNGIMFTVLAVMSTSRMAALESRMAALENTLTTRFDLIMGRLMDLHTRLTRLAS